MRAATRAFCCVCAVVAAAGAPAQMSMPTAAPASASTLTLAGPASTGTLTLAELAVLPHHTVTGQNGHTHASETYTGVELLTLLARVGAPTGGDVHGKALGDYIVATGADGYKAVLSLAEAEPDFHPGEILVADTLDGKPLGAQGPMKLIVSEDKRPARCVHNLVRLDLKAAE